MIYTVKANIKDSFGNTINPAKDETLQDIYYNQVNSEQITKIKDSWGDNIAATIMNQLTVAENSRLSGGVFNGTTPDSNYYTTSLSANGNAVISGATLNVSTTTDSGSSSLVYTKSLGRYIGSNMNYFRAIMRFGDIGVANNTRRFGIFNGSSFTDGFFFQLSGTTFSIVSRTNNSDTAVNSGWFNGLDPTWVVDKNYHNFEIWYTHKTIQFYIDNVLIQQITQTTSPICSTRHFKAFIQNFSTNVSSACSIFCDAITINRYGPKDSQGKSYFQQGLTNGVLLKVGPGAIHLLNISGVQNNSVITLYDGLTTAGTVIWSSGTMGAQTQPFGISLDGEGGTLFETGLYMTITGAASNCFIKYE